MSYADWLNANGIMVREEWLQATPWIGGSPNFSKNSVDHMTKHYMGGNGIDCSDIPKLLRNMQNDYRNSRGYDLGYSFGSDQAGNLYEIRGLRVRAASDGSEETNTTTVSCLGMSPNTYDEMSPQMESADAALMAAVREYCNAEHWIGHRDAFSTSCCGDPWYEKVCAGDLEPSGTPPPPEPQPIPPPVGDDDMAIPCGFITCNRGVGGHCVDGSSYSSPVDGTTYKVLPGGTIQWVRDPEQLAAMLSIANAAGSRTDTWNTPVGDPDAFGLLLGEKPS